MARAPEEAHYRSITETEQGHSDQAITSGVLCHGVLIKAKQSLAWQLLLTCQFITLKALASQGLVVGSHPAWGVRKMLSFLFCLCKYVLVTPQKKKTFCLWSRSVFARQALAQRS